MLATIVLGIFIAAGFFYGLLTIYRNFFKGEAACCDSGSCSGNCSCCSKCGQKNFEIKNLE